MHRGHPTARDAEHAGYPWDTSGRISSPRGGAVIRAAEQCPHLYDHAVRRAATSPNDQVRAARLRHPSTLTPGEPLSRQELAERVNRWIYEQDQTITEIDANYIGKLERGVIRWPQRRYREALRAILRAETDRDLGFHRPVQSANGGVEVDRQQFLRAAAVASAATALPA